MEMGSDQFVCAWKKEDDIEEPMSRDKLKGRQKCCRWWVKMMKNVEKWVKKKVDGSEFFEVDFDQKCPKSGL
jgi:hypothetical protein